MPTYLHTCTEFCNVPAYHDLSSMELVTIPGETINNLPAAEFYKRAAIKQNADIEETLAPALGYPYDERYGWVTGDHVAESLAIEAANRITALVRERAEWRTNVEAALREQASEATLHRAEPGYSTYDCDQNAMWFSTIADWLHDHWDDILPAGTEASVIYVRLHGKWEPLHTLNAEQVLYLRDMQAQHVAAQVRQAKAQGWDEGRTAGLLGDTTTNPYNIQESPL